MSGRACRRRWEAEAARDGRLTGQALSAFEQHALHCKDCDRERRALAALSSALAVSTVPDDEVALRRGRERLLETAHARLHGRARVPRAFAAVAFAALCAVVGVLTVLHRSHRDVAPGADIVASPGARWERRLTDTAESVVLSEGVLTLTVRHSSGARPLLLRVPDGTIEDVGTVFRVTVRDGRTREIAVSQGSVTFRRRAESPVLLRGPSLWAPPPDAAPARTNDAELAPVAKDQGHGMASKPSAPKAKPSPERASVRERRALAADEDLAYLRIVALRREGRSDEARIAAAEYLRAFPAGFRRAEVLAFVRAPN